MFAPLSVVAETLNADETGLGEGFEVGLGVGVGLGLVVEEDDDDDDDDDEEEDEDDDVSEDPVVGAEDTENTLLLPVGVPSVAVMVTCEPGAVTVTEVDPTPLTKAAILSGVMDPPEYVKDGVPLYPVTMLSYASIAVTVMVKAEPTVGELAIVLKTKWSREGLFTLTETAEEFATPLALSFT